MRGRLLVAVCCLLAVACGSQSQGPSGRAPASPEAGDAVSGDVTVFAAASLTDVFEAMGTAFERANPDAHITFNFASSSTLATQITEGAPADVFAAANGRQMQVVADVGLVADEPIDFTGNTLEIAVEPGNPLGISRLADLTHDDVTVVLAAEEVPAGRYAREAIDGQSLGVRPASLETDVRAVLSRVALGEADAGVVYSSDVASAGGDVEGVPIPAEENVPATYPIATLDDAADPTASRAFVDLVLSEEGRRLLRRCGFQPL